MVVAKYTKIIWGKKTICDEESSGIAHVERFWRPKAKRWNKGYKVSVKDAEIITNRTLRFSIAEAVPVKSVRSELKSAVSKIN